ncbi:O-antigen ligase family protein [Marinicrinis sediminis]|uniref:O-antigen ligase family protein n=1 Tax=Marinicrinis sediminis TaxID=1652465 RepID=A0ABW5RB84_9BACL
MKGRSKLSKKKQPFAEPVPGMLWVILVLSGCFFIWSPFQIALFNGGSINFEGPISYAVIFTSIICFVTGIWIPLKQLPLSPSHLGLAIASFLLPLSYLLSKLNAASHYLSNTLVLIMLSATFFYIIAITVASHEKANRLIQHLLISSFYLIVWFGLWHWFGNGPLARFFFGWFAAFNDLGVYVDAVMTDSNGLRLTSVFQYANTYAAFLTVVLFACLHFITKAKLWWVRALHGFMLVPIFISFWLTLSRGGLVILPVVLVILLMFLKPAKQIVWILQLMISLISTGLILKPVTEIGLAMNNQYSGVEFLKGYTYVLGLSILVGFCCAWLMESKFARLTQKWSNLKWSSLYLPLGTVLFGGLLLWVILSTGLKTVLPDNVQTRLKNINFSQHSVLERATFYEDSLKLVADYPMLGAGGGAWSVLYEKYQNNPYTSRQAHNFYLQYLVETGWVGFLIFLSFVSYILYRYIRMYRHQEEAHRNDYFLYFIIVVSLLVLSLIDFNMTYVYLLILVFFSLGGITASFSSTKANVQVASYKKYNYMLTAIMVIGSIAATITAGLFLKAEQSYYQATEILKSGQVSIQEVTSHVDKALSIRSSHPYYASLKASFLQQVYEQTADPKYIIEAKSLLLEVQLLEPYNKMLFKQTMSILISQENYREALALSQEQRSNYPWDISLYEQELELLYKLGSTAYDQGQEEEAYPYFEQAFILKATIEKKQAHLDQLPEEQMQGRPFELSQTTKNVLGKMYYFTGQYALAEAILVQSFDTPLSSSSNLDGALWYLAALLKQDKENEALEEAFIEMNYNYEQQVNNLLELKPLDP